MAATKGKSLFGYPTNAGGKVIDVVPVAGSASYVSGTGQTFAYTAQYRSIDMLIGSVSISGTYRIECQTATYGQQRVWKLRWIVISTGIEAANGNLSAETVQLAVIAS